MFIEIGKFHHTMRINEKFDKTAQTKTRKEKVMPLLNVETHTYILNETVEADQFTKPMM